jgi:threonine dehydratase
MHGAGGAGEPTLREIREASRRVEQFTHRTPVLTSRSLDRLTGSRLFLKCENFQKTGSFKARGATNAVFSLSDAEASRGVATHSSGNYAAALAFAARLRGIDAHLVMPENAARVKREAVVRYGGRITSCAPTLASREEVLEKVISLTGATFLHPYNDYRVIAGQGTAALELCEDIQDLDVVMAPVGGGGLVSGTAIAVSSLSPGTRVIAAEPAGADDAARSLREGSIVKIAQPHSIADGLLTSLGDLTFPVIKRHVETIVTVSEEAIASAMRAVWETMKIVIEPSAAVTVAALLDRRIELPGMRVGIILSGGNVDFSNLSRRPGD